MWISVAKPSFGLEQVDTVLDALEGPPEGLEARYIGTTADGSVRVVSLWRSQADAERFFSDTLGPTIARALGPEPSGAAELVGIDVARTYVGQPVS